MEVISILFCLSFVCACLFLVISSTRRLNPYPGKLPPGPSPLPIVGDLFKLNKDLHRSFAELAKTYGPLMSVKLGTVTAIVVSSSSMAKQVLQKYDQIFSSRTIPNSAHALDNYKFSVIWMPPTAQWRYLRNICNLQMFTKSKLDSNQALRHNKVKELLAYIEEKSRTGHAVDIGQVAFSTTLNLISNTMFSIDLANLKSETVQEFKSVVRGTLEEAGRPNFSDYFPVLKSLDLQGIRRRMALNLGKLDQIFDGIINKRMELKELGTSDDLLDKLLQYSREDNTELSRSHVNTLLRDIFVAGTDTSSTTVEWAMTELLRNPKVMEKAKVELKQAIEKDNPIEESDIARLPYLQAIVKETFRLHPPVPLLIPRKCEIETNLCGFTIPKNALVMVNIWAIGQNSNIWKFPASFEPDRFLGSDIDFKGHDFELTPFGAGRRICPGLPLADRMVHLMLASLIHSFDWKLEEEAKAEDVNMEENFGISLQKAQPLRVIPVKA